MSFSSSEEDTALSYIHDLGFIAKMKDGKRGFKVMLGGGLGSQPRHADELYDFLFVNRSKSFGTDLWRFDATYVDGAVNRSAWATVRSAEGSGWWDRWIVDGAVRFVGGFVKTFSWPVRLIQTGYVQNYALMMILGVLVFIGYVFWG